MFEPSPTIDTSRVALMALAESMQSASDALLL
jgi:hypothetical protein